MTDSSETKSMLALHTVPSTVLEEVRASGEDPAGTPIVEVCARGGEPLRCCLRDAREREEIMLFGYTPPLPRTPYRETGAVYAHRHACAGPTSRSAYPDGWRGRPQVLRAYDRRGWIHPASRTHDGSDPEAAIRQVLDEPGVVQVHSRNVVHGCYMFAVTRG